MGLTQALGASLSGLQATQAGLSVVAGNVANAQTPGYVARTVTQVETVSPGGGNGVNVSGINRQLDTYVQGQLWTESAGGGYADLSANFYQQLQQVYGQPGSATALDTVFNNFTSAIQALSSSPASFSVQSQAVNAAQVLAQQLNNATQSIQTLRTEADQGIASDVQQANLALQQIAQANQKLATGGFDPSTADTLEDQRDQAITQLSKLMNITVLRGDNNQISVLTSTGVELAGTTAGQLSFTATGSISASQQWSGDPTKSGLSGITLVSPSGQSTDLVATNSLQSGEIGAYVNMRDNVLVQAQSQLDQLAAQMSSAISDTTTAGTAVTVGPNSGFDVNLGNVANGNTIHLTYTDSVNVQHTVTIMRVDDPSALPLPNSATTDPNDTVIGLNFSGGAASVATQLNTALAGAGLQFSNPSGSTLEVLDTGTGTTVNAASTTTTASTLTGGSGALPLFVDGANPYTGVITGTGSEVTGFAGRISVNQSLVDDPSGMIDYSPSTAPGDATRPNFIYNQLVNGTYQYSPSTGLGSPANPYQGTLSNYLSQVVNMQSTAANNATNLQSGQDVVVNALQSRFNSTSSVSIDTEMTNLLTLQNTYGANARVVTTVKSMLDTLMQMI